MQRESPAAWDTVERKMMWKKAWSLFWGRSENVPYASSFFKTEKEKKNHNNGRKEVTLPVVWWDRPECMNWDHDPQLTPLSNELKPQCILKLRDPSFHPEPHHHIRQSVNTSLYQSAIKATAFESRSYNQLKAKLRILHSTIGLLSLLHEKLLIAVP